MWNKPNVRDLSSLPALYATEHVPAADKIMHMHFFFDGGWSGCHWYVAEFDGEDLFFGFAVLNGDIQNAEWGYFSLSELDGISVHGIEVELDLYWRPAPAGEIDAIAGWI